MLDEQGREGKGRGGKGGEGRNEKGLLLSSVLLYYGYYLVSGREGVEGKGDACTPCAKYTS